MFSDSVKMNNLKKKTFEKINSRDYSKKVINEYLSEQSPRKIRKNMETGEYFVLEYNGKLLGMIELYDNNIVGGMYIKHDCVGKGYGKKLMSFIENYAKKKGLKELVLYPTLTARGFYKKIGYKETGNKNYWKGYTVFEMKKKLK